jgi:hypothetical protein
MAISKAKMAIPVAIAVNNSRDINVPESLALSFLTAAISLTPTVVMPIMEIRTK